MSAKIEKFPELDTGHLAVNALQPVKENIGDKRNKKFRDLKKDDRIEVVFQEPSDRKKRYRASIFTGIVIDRCFWNDIHKSSVIIKVDDPGTAKMRFCVIYDKNYIRTIFDNDAIQQNDTIQKVTK